MPIRRFVGHGTTGFGARGEHFGIRADGFDLHGWVHRDRALASAGTTAVDLSGGKLRHKVPGNSRAGDAFRLPGQGTPA